MNRRSALRSILAACAAPLLPWGKMLARAPVAAPATTSVTVTTGTWAAGMWSGMEGAQIEFIPLAPRRWWHRMFSRRRVATIAAVDLESRTITFDAPTGATSGDSLHFKGDDSMRFDEWSIGEVA